MMNNEELKSIVFIIFLVCASFMTFYLVITFPTYFSGFFFGLLFYSFVDAIIKKDL